jgi:hypothetical protein
MGKVTTPERIDASCRIGGALRSAALWPPGRAPRQALSGLVLALCAWLPAPAQIAPGPIARAHQEWKGLTRCGTCHEFGAVSSGFKCLECHAEIRRRVEGKLGFHGRNYRPTDNVTDCRRCHKEHKGEATPLIHLDRQNFDHFAQTGFRLEGKHRQQRCAACHNAAHIPASSRAEIKVKDLNRTFLGLHRECTSCHKDQHQGQLGTDCLRCHTPDAFKPPSRFNHAAAAFPLTGQHLSLPCAKCHGPRPGGSAMRFKGLPHEGCQSCHQDPHHGAFQEVRFRGSCDTCHNTSGFKSNRPGENFNHPASKFDLAGKHTEVPCAKCHKGSDFHRPIPHEHCRDCHEGPHKGQFVHRVSGSDCSSCHSVTGFKPTRFDREMHRQAPFPLEGKHAALPCAKCHQPEGRDAVYKSGKLTCPACHADRHAGEFAATPHNNNCKDCHTFEGFKPNTFSIERHAATGFPLSGRHAALACEKCHTPLPAADPANFASARRFHFPVKTCDNCHGNPHQTKVACDTCHTTEDWKALRVFDHSKTGFKITGAHQNLKCTECHKPRQPGEVADAPEVIAPAPPTAPIFARNSMECSGCHAAKDPHGGQFTNGNPPEDCSHCHVPVRWNGENFSHDQSRFILNQVHRKLECARCHKQKEIAGKPVRLFRGTPRECIQCH